MILANDPTIEKLKEIARNKSTQPETEEEKKKRLESSVVKSKPKLKKFD